MRLSSRRRQCKETTNQSYISNSTSKSKRKRKPLSQNLIHEVSSLQKSKRKFSQKENSNTSAPNKRCEAKLLRSNTAIQIATKRRSMRQNKNTSNGCQVDDVSLMALRRSNKNATTTNRSLKTLGYHTPTENHIDPVSSPTCSVKKKTVAKRKSVRLSVNTPKEHPLDAISFLESPNTLKKNHVGLVSTPRCNVKSSTTAKRMSARLSINIPKKQDQISLLESPKFTRSARNTKVPLFSSTPINQSSINLQNCDNRKMTSRKGGSKKPNDKNKIKNNNFNKEFCMPSPLKTVSSERMTLRLHENSVKQIAEVNVAENMKQKRLTRKRNFEEGTKSEQGVKKKRPQKESSPQKNAKTEQSARQRHKPKNKADSGKKAQVKYKSFAGFPSIDDLSLTKHRKRKEKSENFKLPSKNTLKRKRFVIYELNKANEDYEDDIYENAKFDHFKDLLEDTESDASSTFSMVTPKLGFHVTPKFRNVHSPIFKDCISPGEYAFNRKLAEEIQFRNKKWKSMSAEAEAEKTSVVPEKKRLEFNQVLTSIENQQETIQKIVEDDPSDDEDNYLSDT